MISRTTADFRSDFRRLPKDVQKLARDAFVLFLDNPQHPSLRFKKLPPHAHLWSARINAGYRAVGNRLDDKIIWFFVGSHADYDQLLRRIEP